ncbi:MAG: protein-export chaperone SecB [Alcanivoracaceae bacterium]|nr:protein-export chaperone SecB [Alcanivoracaceae bacterium]
MTKKTVQDQGQQQTTDANFQIHKIYVKDLSFEIPSGSEVFHGDWKPNLNLHVHTSSNALSDENSHEVVLKIKCEVTSNDKECFVIELEQAGIFSLKNVTDEQLRHALGAFSPNILYPYAREVISEIVSKGGFPQLALAPIDFEIMYQQEMEKRATAKTD